MFLILLLQKLRRSFLKRFTFASISYRQVSKLGAPVIYDIVDKISDILAIKFEQQESLYDEMAKSLRGVITTDIITYDKCGSLSKLPLDILLYIFT